MIGCHVLCVFLLTGDHAAAPSAADGLATGSTAANAPADSNAEDPAAAAGQGAEGQGAAGEEAVVVEGSAADRYSSKASLQRYRKVSSCLQDLRALLCRPRVQH